jgi:hypothetical protein
MSVPLNRLYDFLHDSCKPYDIIIYRYLPHGSRNLADCKAITDTGPPGSIKFLHYARMVCHDQESVDYKEFAGHLPISSSRIADVPYPVLQCITKKELDLHDAILLLHSEQNSTDVAWLEQFGTVSVYYWSHAMIALDWFRYAEHDPLLHSQSTPAHDFLIYNRAWAGLREYRLKFTELIIDTQLVDKCQLTFNPDDSQHYTAHKFANAQFQISRYDFETILNPTMADSSASADYSSIDYQNSWIEVVLETVFDDTKLHLTEKSLRPIACGKPFILAATPGSLGYLRSYGFKTFGNCWDESYDLIQDPVARLQAIVALMQELSQLTPDRKKELSCKIAKICAHNKQLFFSKKFQQYVITEFKQNLALAMLHMKQHKNGRYLQKLKNAAVDYNGSGTEIWTEYINSLKGNNCP